MSLGMNTQVSEASIAVLRHVLADTYVLQVKTQSYHWHVEGISFHALHKMFESQYEEMSAAADDIAERIRALGGTAIGSMAGFLEYANLKEDIDAAERTDLEMCEQLAHDHLTFISHMRGHIEDIKDLGDEATIDLLVERLRAHDKIYWMLQASCK